MQNFSEIKHELEGKNVTLVAVSKTKSIEQILEVYHQGQRIFGENRVPELIEKAQKMSDDIAWHMIGHLQRNKVKGMAPYVSMIHSIDRIPLLKEVNKQAGAIDRIIPCLLQLKIAKEETKSGFSFESLLEWLSTGEHEFLMNIQLVGVMGMASFVDDMEVVRKEFQYLKQCFDKIQSLYFQDNRAFSHISMGMSGDYKIAIEEGSTMVRIGSLIFGARNYT